MRGLAIAVGAAIAGLWTVASYPVAAEMRPYPVEIPPEYSVPVEFLTYLKPAREAVSGFEAGVAPKWDVDRLMTFISNEGLTVSDVNRSNGKPQNLSIKQIRTAIAARKGQIFVTLAHLGYIYMQPYKQYSELRFQPQAGGGVVIHMADWYQLRFSSQERALQLTHIDYLMREGH